MRLVTDGLPKLTLPRGIRPTAALLAGMRLEAQTLEHNKPDYDAVMHAREHLRAWSGDPWPEDTWTLEQNREDLAGHIADAESGFAYGYTVWNAAGSGVAGSVYLYPPVYLADRYRLPESAETEIRRAGVLVEYWLRPEIEAAQVHAAFIAALVDWLREALGFASAVWTSRPALTERRKRYEEAGFTALAKAESRFTPGWIQWFHVSR